MVNLRVTDRDGKTHDVKAVAGARLMFILRDDASLPVEGIERLPARSSEERDMLESLANMDERRSRLSCQIEVTAAVEGLVLTLAAEE